MARKKTINQFEIEPQQENIDLEILKMVHEHFLQDLRDFWSRSNFYLVVQAGLISVFVSQRNMNSTYSAAVSLGLATLGFLLAIAWLVVMRGAIHWIRRWRKKVVELDIHTDPHKAFATVETEVSSSPFLSPSNVTSWIPIFFIIAWPLLILNLMINSNVFQSLWTAICT